MKEPPEHDLTVHRPESDLFYMACRRCMWLMGIRDQAWKLPGRHVTEALVERIQDKSLPTADDVLGILK